MSVKTAAKSSFFRSLAPSERYMVANLFFLYLVQGVFTIGIGSVLPMLKAEYGLSYRVGGMLISSHSVGNIVIGLFAGLLPIAIGYKRALLSLNVLPYIGFALTLLTRNPILLVLALLLTGLGRGAISNYNNQIINQLSGGSSAPLNMLHGFFAIGALFAPFLVLFCTRGSQSGWRYAVLVFIFLGIITMISSPFMQMDRVTSAQSGQNKAGPMLFLRNRLFWLTAGIMLAYLSVEASIMGWLVTYFVDSGAATANAAQILTALLWITILIGRFGCTLLTGRVSTRQFLLCASIGIAFFLGVIVLTTSLVPLLVGTVGLGLCMAGMYGTTVSNATDVLASHPLAMGVFCTLTGAGSIAAPSIIGVIAQAAGIRTGMAILFLPAALLIGFTLKNALRKQNI